MWFPSWDGLAPRKDTSAVLPTRIVVDHKVPKPDQVLNDEGEYGRRWLLDHGGPLDPMVQKSYRVLHQLKWGRHVGPRRRAYLLRLLEQAAAWRAQTTPSGANKEALPNEVTAVFTVPLRMRDEVRAFETDVKHVVTDLKRLTGISLQPLFQWESNAGAVPSRARRPERVYATIDLGGGSLDFWGCYFDNNGVAHQHADSLRLGGGALIRALAQDGNAAYIDEALRKLGPEEAPSDVLSEIAGYSEKVSFFFETVREVCARWLAALSKEAEANGSPAEEFNVGMLGRAWFMGGPDWRGSVRALRLIQTRMKELGCERPLVRHRDVPEGQTDRKTYLARYVAGFSRDAEKSMTSILDEQNGFVGTNLDHEVGHGRQEVIKWFTPLPIPSPDDSKFYLGRTSADRDRLHPSLPRALAEAVPKYENTILDRINRKGGDQGGYRDSHGVHLTRSPFHSLIELAMDGWAGDES
jgi:hypothetical protein